MKTFLKVLGTTALLASLVPFSHKKDEEAGQDTYQALLWSLVSRPDPEAENKRKLEITLGFNCPFSKKNEDEEAHLFADELTVNYHPVPTQETSAPEEAAPEEAPAVEEESVPEEAPAAEEESAPEEAPESNQASDAGTEDPA